MSSRSRTLPIATVLLVALTASCSPAGGTDPSGAAVPGTDAPTETVRTDPDLPAPDGTLVVAIDSDPGHLNPAITTSGGTHTASELLYNGLVGLDEDLTPVPELAEDWEIGDDGRTYTFTLRDDVTWHDGEPFTAEDVVVSFEEVLLEFHSRTSASIGEALSSLTAPDDHTVVFSFDAPYAPLLQQLHVTEAPIVPAHVYAGTDPLENPANLAPVGTGPFRFVSYTPDSEIVFERYDDHFAGAPELERVVQRIIPEASNQVISLEAGEVEWLWGVPGPDRARLEADPQVRFLSTAVNPGGQNCVMTVSLNLERPMFRDLRLRRALYHALDRDAFVERVLFGEGRVADAPIHSGIPWAHGEDLDLPAFDPTEADRLLTEAGWVRDGAGVRTARGVAGVDDGTPLAFDLLHFPAFGDYAELLRAQLAAVGAEVTLRPLEPPVFVESVFVERDFDTNIISYCNGTDPEIGVRRMYISSNIRPIPFSNAAAYAEPTVDAWFDEAQATIDLEARGDLYQRIQEQLAEDLPYLWLVETESTRAFRASCTGFRPFGHFAATASC